MVFVTTDDGCFICLSHRHNVDGYLRKTWKHGGPRQAEMFHRFIYRAHKGEIPEGHEVDHLCNVRPCCNPAHLQTLGRSEHKAKTNRNRYAERRATAKKVWKELGLNGMELADRFGVTFGNAYRWIREWQLEENT